MKESNREGVANHPGPEPCEGGGKAAIEALDRGICRLGIELRNRVFQDDHLVLDNFPQRTPAKRLYTLGKLDEALHTFPRRFACLRPVAAISRSEWVRSGCGTQSAGRIRAREERPLERGNVARALLTGHRPWKDIPDGRGG